MYIINILTSTVPVPYFRKDFLVTNVTYKLITDPESLEKLDTEAGAESTPPSPTESPTSILRKRKKNKDESGRNCKGTGSQDKYMLAVC